MSATHFPRPPARLSSGVTGRDRVRGGGLFRGDMYVVVGEPGTGKTVLANQLSFHEAAQGRRVVYLTLLTEMHARMLAHLSNFSFFAPGRVGNDILYLSGYQALESGGRASLLATAHRAIKEQSASLLVIDGLATLRAAADDALSFKKFVHDLQSFVALLDCTALLVTEPSPAGHRHVESPVVDGLIEIEDRSVGLRAVRLLRVLKLRGSDYVHGTHELAITSGGIEVYPRLEAVLARPSSPPASNRERRGFGLPPLDGMMRGGLPPGSAGVVLGASGTGKTLLGLHFLSEGCELGEHGVYLGFNEMPESLLRSTQPCGLDLAAARDRGLLDVLWEPPLEHAVDKLAETLVARVRERRSQRVVIDGVAEFRESALPRRRTGRLLVALLHELRAAGATALLTDEANPSTGASMDVPGAPLSALADNVVLLRHVELRASLHRLLSIPKMRGCEHDTAVRTFTIGGDGIHLAESSVEAEAILSDLAHEAPGSGRRA